MEGKQGKEGKEWKERRGRKGRDRREGRGGKEGKEGAEGMEGKEGVNWMPILVPGAARVLVMGRPVLLPIDRLSPSTGCPRKGRK